MAKLNYAEAYAKELAQAYPYTLYFGALWNATKPEVKFIDNNTIKLPNLKTTGRVDGNRDVIGTFTRNFDNDWETKVLKTHRTWGTLVHPRDIDETNKVASIANITKTFNEEQKFPEMDAEAINAVYAAKNEIEAITPTAKGSLTADNVLAEFDKLMDKMDEARVPANGRILYVDTFTKTLIDAAKEYRRSADGKTIARSVSRIDEVEIVPVPTAMMKTEYEFFTGSDGKNGFAAKSTASDVKMFLVHLSAVIPAIVYEFAQLDEPFTLSQGKYVYFEESFEDMFIYNKKHDAIQFYVEAASA